MKKVIKIIGILFIAGSIILFLSASFIMVSDGSVTRDIFGFIVPKPPMWTSFIPFGPTIIGFILEYFSLHGLVALIVPLILFTIGTNLTDLYKK